jgi:hypothetical protein
LIPHPVLDPTSFSDMCDLHLQTVNKVNRPVAETCKSSSANHLFCNIVHYPKSFSPGLLWWHQATASYLQILFRALHKSGNIGASPEGLLTHIRHQHTAHGKS